MNNMVPRHKCPNRDNDGTCGCELGSPDLDPEYRRRVATAESIRSAPPVAAPSGEAAPREAVEIVKEVNEIMTPCSSHAPVPAASCRGCLWKTIGRLSNSLRTLSQGKAAAEARAEEAEATVQTLRNSLCVAADRMKDPCDCGSRWRASESRCAALEANLRIFIHAHASGNSVPPHIEAAARAALSSAEPAKPVMPECVAKLIRFRSNRMHEGDQAYLYDLMKEVCAYYAKPSATAGADEGEG